MENKNADQLISVHTPAFISHMLIPTIILTGLLVAFFFNLNNPLNYWIIIFILFIIYKLWTLFEPNNRIKIDKTNNSLILISRNPFKRVIQKRVIIPITSIKEINIQEGREIMLEGERYIVCALLKDAAIIPVAQTSNKNLANKIVESIRGTLFP